MVNMNRLTIVKRTAVVKALVEGCSIRATVRTDRRGEEHDRQIAD